MQGGNEQGQREVCACCTSLVRPCNRSERSLTESLWPAPLAPSHAYLPATHTLQACLEAAGRGGQPARPLSFAGMRPGPRLRLLHHLQLSPWGVGRGRSPVCASPWSRRRGQVRRRLHSGWPPAAGPTRLLLTTAQHQAACSQPPPPSPLLPQWRVRWQPTSVPPWQPRPPLLPPRLPPPRLPPSLSRSSATSSSGSS